VIVRDDHFLYVRQVNVQVARILQYRFGMASGVEQNAMTIGLHECGKTPLANTGKVAHQHGGKDGDFDCIDLRGRLGSDCGRSLGPHWLGAERQNGKRG
jgi:hypothetical protein